MSVKEFKEQEKLAQKELDKMHQEALKKPKPNKFNRKPIISKRDRHIAGVMILSISVVTALVLISNWFDHNRLVWQFPILFRTPVYSEKREGVEKELPTTELPQLMPATPTPTPSPTPMPKKARVSAYSCVGLKTEAEIRMNCPSLLFNNGVPLTSSQTTPIPNRTISCDPANKGKEFEVEGLGILICEDTGNSIIGAGRFDLYVAHVQEAREFGVQELAYREIK